MTNTLTILVGIPACAYLFIHYSLRCYYSHKLEYMKAVADMLADRISRKRATEN